MKKAVVLTLVCMLLLSACAPLTAAPTKPAVTASPAATPPEDVYVSQGEEYATSADARLQGNLLTDYRPFPGKWSDEELRAKLNALPPIHLETPQSGEEKLYFKDDPIDAGCLTEGMLTLKELKTLVKTLGSGNPGQQLKETLGGCGLTFQSMGDGWQGDFDLYDESADTPCRATLREMQKGVYLITVAPVDAYRRPVCHLVFCEENGAYRFAAMCMPSGESNEFRDSIVSANGLSYFVCNCDMGWGTGTYCRYFTVCPMQEGVHGRLWYQADGYDCPWSICENRKVSFPEPESAKNGGAHFALIGSFDFANYSDLHFEGFEDVFCGTFTAHIYDDGDGKGFYMYAGDIGLNFGLYDSEALKALFSERAALMLAAQDDETCLLAENFVWERNLSPEGYPYLSSAAIYERGEAIREKPYAEDMGAGIKYYVGNGAPQPEASGSLGAAALAALEMALSSFDTDAAVALKAAGLTLPAGVTLPESSQPIDQRGADFKRLVRYEMGDALALELRAPDAEGWMFDSIVLLFLRGEEGYTFLTALPRWGYVYDEPDASKAAVCAVGGLNYLHLYASPKKEGDDPFIGDVWVPFLRGGATGRFRSSGGCALNGVSGAPLRYWLEIPIEGLAGQSLQTLAAEVHYDLYEADVRFTVPLRLYNDGDGKGFYSLDANSMYLFTDILSAPYARDQIESQLRLHTESSRRETRAVAAALLKKVFGD